MKIAIGNDHAATELKFIIMDYVKSLGHEVVNFGTDGNQSCNYPEFGEKVGRAVVGGEADCGILICGTGVGISIAANKVNGVRAAVCSDCATARLVKEHNNANIIAFGARIVGSELAKDIVKAYLDAEFQGGRHQTRIDMIHEIETRNQKIWEKDSFLFRETWCFHKKSLKSVAIYYKIEKSESLVLVRNFLRRKFE